MSDLAPEPRGGPFLARRRRPLAIAFSLAAHLAVIAAFVTARSEPAKVFQLQLMSVELITPPPVEPAEPIDPEKPAEAPAKAPKRQDIFRESKAPAPPDAEPMPAGEAKTPSPGVEVSDSLLAGAATAGSGPAGGACNMPRLLQNALRKDRMVQAALADIHRGKAISIWNGGWVRHGEQDGAGLAAVREAIMWEIGFAPEACRSQVVRGLVVISLSDSPGAPRIVVGSGAWRWTDLLFSPNGGA